MVIFKLEVGPFIEAIAPDGMISLSESIIHIVALLLIDAQGEGMCHPLQSSSDGWFSSFKDVTRQLRTLL